MSYSDYKNILKSIKNKPGKIKKYNKHNVSKKRSCGFAKQRCQLCKRIGGHVGKYGLSLCRQCFRENAQRLGFKKFN